MPDVLQIDLTQLYTPHAGQALVHASKAKHKVLKAGRRWGKGRCALFEGLNQYIQALRMPAPRSLIPPFHMWIVVPTFPQARQVWAELLSFIPPEFQHSVLQDQWTIYLLGTPDRTWGQLEVKSAHDPDNLQTVGLDYLWVSESQDISNKAFEKLLPTLRSPGRNGQALFEGIPAMYADHWFERVYRLAEQKAEGYEAFHYTSFDNPLLTEEDKREIERDKELMPERAWQRMYMAEFNEDAGYFSNISGCISGDILKIPVPGARYVAGLDLGRKADASVLTVLDAQDRQVRYIYAWDAGQSWPAQREGVTRLCRQWAIERLVVDATGMGGDIFTSELVEANLPVEPFIITHNSRDALLTELGVALERETVHFPPDTNLLRQLRSFQYRKMPGGSIRAEAPEGEHDDYVFSLGLGLTACDAPHTLFASMGGNRSGSRRYVPTQQEAQTGGLRTGAALRRHEVMLDRMVERHTRTGVKE